MRDALAGEMNRRQELLRQRGQLRQRPTTSGPGRPAPPLDPLPALFIVIDEFSELLAARAGVHRPVRRDRPDRPLAAGAPAAGLAAPGGGQAARPGHPPVLPDRAEDVLRGGVAGGARRAGRLRAAVDARLGLPEVRHRDRMEPLQGGVRLRAPTAPRARPPRPAPATGHARTVRPQRSCPTVDLPEAVAPAPRRDAAADDGAEPQRAGRDGAPRCAGRGRPPTRCGCRRWTRRRRWTSCCRRCRSTAERGLTPAGFAGNGPAHRAGRHRGQALRAAPRPALGSTSPAPPATPWSSAARSTRQVHAAAHDADRRWRSPTPRTRCSSSASTSAAARWRHWRACRTVGGVAGRLDAGRGAAHRRRGDRSARRSRAAVPRPGYRLDG